MIAYTMKFFAEKLVAKQWLDVHRVAHELGINSNATMLYGHVETRDRTAVNHMLLLREEQDRAHEDNSQGKFQTIIPLPFIPGVSELAHLCRDRAVLKIYERLQSTRLMLDNIPHVKAFWIMQTIADGATYVGVRSERY